MTGWNSTLLWYTSRATGVVLLLLVSAVVLLGVLVDRQVRLPGLPRFGVVGLHRNLSLLAVVFLAVHVLTAVADSYVSIPLIATVVPFSSGYEALWLGLGTVALDLIAAVVVTSLLRARMRPRAWRAVHWLGYAAYPLVVAHSIGASHDLRSGWLLWLTVGSVLAVATAAAYRLAKARASIPRPRRVGQLLAGRPLDPGGVERTPR